MGINMGIYGIGLWLPQIIKQLGHSDFVTTLMAALPYLVATPLMLLWARNSDRTGERRWHAVIPCVACSLGLGASALFHDPLWSYVALMLATVGIMTSMANFWALPTGTLAGSAAAGGIALINSVGNLGGFGGSYLVGYLRQITNRFQASLLFLAVCPLLAAVILYALARRRPRLPMERTPAISLSGAP
jgi:ACS family tartrate transporter-like MFS transporter